LTLSLGESRVKYGDIERLNIYPSPSGEENRPLSLIYDNCLQFLLNLNNFKETAP
jgi:hypothetical protein